MDIRLHPAYEAAITRIEDLKLTLATAYSRLSDLQTTQVPSLKHVIWQPLAVTN